MLRKRIMIIGILVLSVIMIAAAYFGFFNPVKQVYQGTFVFENLNERGVV